MKTKEESEGKGTLGNFYYALRRKEASWGKKCKVKSKKWKRGEWRKEGKVKNAEF
jgi:hypothetical protein